MITKKSSNEARKKRHQRIRNRVVGTAARPRLCVFRSLKHIYAQVVDDAAGHTLASASTLDAGLKDALASLPKTEDAAREGGLVF
jgi:large subunit ribosomal protein L18